MSGPPAGELPLRRPGRHWLRIGLAVVGGNLLGFGAWQLAGALIPRLWAGRTELSHPLVLMGLIFISSVLFAGPPVFVGALSGWVARRWHIWVGLASGLWAISLIGRVPVDFPIAPGLWYAPAVLVLLSGALGGWSISGIKDEG